ncbi:hypothetical protein DKG75_05290 [Zavarzinia compransoris]|uniref:HTH tetR-type domain-containing protein n=2 Tax=Zavarzinia compransoris TaxID=1264899 RepID=A0A317EF09_9PROT|nr:hypothetical protein DKG75_05290 [Zavarzinia compransoris]
MGEAAHPWGADGNSLWHGGQDDAAPPAPVPGKVDGRLARSRRTRAAVLDALIALLEEGEFKPPAKVIAERSGVSTRSVFQHFPDLETLFTAAVAHGVERYSPLVQPIGPDQPLKARVGALVRQRFALFEKAGNVYWAGQIAAPLSDTLCQTFARVEYALRIQIEVTFQPELSGLRKPQREARVARLAAFTGFHAWYALRRVEGVGESAAKAAMAETFTALLPE